ncbi:MAG: HAMP domain-containing sensor histidine kinase, partial [Candidatus Hydrogenedentes bacterium]|nr:HAMP domain-containing sensor histidine kinase [Candidatus Hydrogenedentota bacterium]
GPGDATSANRGWYVWYWGDGLNLIYWWRGADGKLFGAEMNSARLAADIIGILPEGAQLGDQGRIVVRDSRGQRIHQWGGQPVKEGDQPAAVLALGWPLASWTLEHYASSNLLGGDYGRGVMMNLAVGLVLLGFAVVALAVYYYRETAREVREASQRVTFVNQVSHELKTPLTNIRMYAELLEDDLQLRLPEEGGQISRCISVIVAESQRLSRLIGNVLTFSRQQRGALTLHPTVVAPDDILREVSARFEPALAARQIKILLDLAAERPRCLDSDVLEQILGNLLNNVEKYAVGATSVRISSTQDGDMLNIIVEDDGPGITLREAGRIFAPFYRVSNRLTDGVSGTGIGLTIARDLARLHGGDLTLETTGPGARFRIRLNAPPGPGAEKLQ